MRTASGFPARGPASRGEIPFQTRDRLRMFEVSQPRSDRSRCARLPASRSEGARIHMRASRSAIDRTPAHGFLRAGVQVPEFTCGRPKLRLTGVGPLHAQLRRTVCPGVARFRIRASRFAIDSIPTDGSLRTEAKSPEFTCGHLDLPLTASPAPGSVSGRNQGG